MESFEKFVKNFQEPSHRLCGRARMPEKIYELSAQKTPTAI
jgi:hypothetical protein